MGSIQACGDYEWNAGVEILLTTVEFVGGEPPVEEGFNHVYRMAARCQAIRDDIIFP